MNIIEHLGSRNKRGQATTIVGGVSAVIAIGVTLAICHIISAQIQSGMSASSTTASNNAITQLATSLTLGDIIPLVLVASLIIAVLVNAFRS